MEFLFYVVICGFLFLYLLAKLLKSQNSRTQKTLPPGPRKLPGIGNMHQLLGSQTHQILADLAAKHGPLMHLQLGLVSTVVVSSPQVAEEVMKTKDIIFAQRPYLLASRILSYDSTNICFSPCGDYWRQLRRISTVELLSTKRVLSFRSIREEEMFNLMASISSSNQKGSTFNLSRGLFSMTYTVTARAAFGKPSKQQEELIKLTGKVVEVFEGFSFADMYPAVKLLETITGLRPKTLKLHKSMDAILQLILREHRDRRMKAQISEEEEDLVDVLLRIQENGDLEIQLTDNNIKAVILDMYIAGSETSSTSMEWTMSEMLKNPKVMKRAQAEVRKAFSKTRTVDESRLHELKYLQAVIKETFRLHPPLPLLLPRECRESCEINGYEIPEKSKVIVNVWAIGRDPEYWTEAEKFNPDRFLDSTVDYKGTDFEFIPFGAGRRICPGVSFALANMEFPLAKLLYHFDWKFPGGQKPEELDMTETFGLTVRRKNDLNLIPIPYEES
ncbi:PREDICTED: cytochrome P450 71D10-like [Ipomoea nil]|uniref:cytochrome P450 71D10-like n=1 Tax=Ipomoea nil TaxID=35883 RepID=UPI0009015E64|nr:PREDICTED: cytochrome P450 71D10-like [Ipomoea nil]